jgi:hemerythrin
MKWSTEYATGIERIDKQHRGLFEMSDDVRAALDEGRGERVYGLLLETFDAYSRLHFDFEDRCMARCQCPADRQNSEAHASFLEALARFQQQYDVKGYDRADAHRFVEFFDRWLTDHVGRIAVQLKPYAANL